MPILARLYRTLPEGTKAFLARHKLFRIYTWSLRRQKKRFITKKIDGVTYHIDLYTYVGASLYNFGVYEPDTTSSIKHFIQSGNHVVDVGASIGAHTLRIASLVGEKGKVYAFEPSENLFPLLLAGISENNFVNRVFPEKMALSDHIGVEEVDMTLLGNLDGSTPKEPRKNVASFTLDYYLAQKNNPLIDFIKIDTDGFEYQILKGSLETIKRCRPVMVVEFRDSNKPQLKEFLSNLGYTFYEPFIDNNYTPKVWKEGVQNVLCFPGVVTQ